MKNFMGKEGFYWWQGVVEDRMDPLKIGRCRVRILGVHTDDKSASGIPTSDLPWAMLLLPVNSEEKIVPPKDGSWVMGFFRDADNCQDPVIIGVLPGIPEEASPNKELVGVAEKGFFDAADNLEYRPINIDSGFEISSIIGASTSTRKIDIEESEKETNLYPRNIGEPDTCRIARNDSEYDPKSSTSLKWKIDNRVLDIQTGTIGEGWDEPDPASTYSAKYPFNKVIETESGHLFELDDTLNTERVNIHHRSGTFIEMQSTGDKVSKVVGNEFNVVILNSNSMAYNNKNETVGGHRSTNTYKNSDNSVKGTYTVWSGDTMYIISNADINIKSSMDINIESTGTVNVKSGDNTNIESGSNTNIKSGSNTNIKSAGNTNIKSGGSTNITSGSSTNFVSPSLTGMNASMIQLNCGGGGEAGVASAAGSASTSPTTLNP